MIGLLKSNLNCHHSLIKTFCYIHWVVIIHHVKNKKLLNHLESHFIQQIELLNDDRQSDHVPPQNDSEQSIQLTEAQPHFIAC